MPLLTKSKYMNGLQCHRLLWFANKKQLPEVDLSTQHAFDQGFIFETFAVQLFPDGINLKDCDFKVNLNKTKELIEKKKTIFEAGVMLDSLYSRSDVLEYKDGWNLYEIKSTSDIKREHNPDLAFQKHMLEKLGIKINKCFVIHLNKNFIKNGVIKPKELCSITEVTEKVNMIDDIKEHIKKFKEVINEINTPDSKIGKHCNNPYTCPLHDKCFEILPEFNVTSLTNWRVYWDLVDKGVLDIKDIPDDTKLSAKDEIIIKSINRDEPFISKDKLKNFLNTLKYPLYHFDFETFATAVPLFDNSKPYQNIPFQYSLHIQNQDSKLEHFEFLYDGCEDPRPLLLEQMKENLSGEGSIVVFNKFFEISVIQKLAENFPEYKDWLLKLIDRIIDLADPFKAFYYYDKSQKGKYSIKKVLPAVTGESYLYLEIQNGGDASMHYFYSHIKPKLELVENKEKIRKNLYKYCKLDTEGMAWILDGLKEVVK